MVLFDVHVPTSNMTDLASRSSESKGLHEYASAKISVDLFVEMVDVKRIQYRGSERYNHQTISVCSPSRCLKSDSLYVNNVKYSVHLMEFRRSSRFAGSDQLLQLTNTFARRQTKYPDVPHVSRISDKKRSVFLVSDQRK
jgi:hypothetical protein